MQVRQDDVVRVFHCSGLLYRTGDVIQPGNWGRVIEGHGSAHNLHMREATFEAVRQTVAPNQASRLRSLFAFEELTAAQQYATEVGLRWIYLLELPTVATSASHRGSLGVFDGLNACFGIDTTLELMRKYWRGEDLGGATEILSESSGLVLNGSSTADSAALLGDLQSSNTTF